MTGRTAPLRTLITVDAEASTVRLIHYTVQEYLCSYPGLFNKPHSIIAETCLTYLNSQQVKNLTPHSLPPHQNMPFLKYSARYWGTCEKRSLTQCEDACARAIESVRRSHIGCITSGADTASRRFRGNHYTRSLLCTALCIVLRDC